jgi:poly(A) polymerase
MRHMCDANKPKFAREAAEHVAATLRRAGHTALLAGGCVRDMLMDRPPADYDVATDAVPARVTALFRRTLLVGEQFGVVVVVLGKNRVEVATFRSESGYADGRHPIDVRFSDARQDAARRDFTINGMFLDPASGEVIDYVGGRADLAARRIRAIGEPTQRFTEDHLRMLRAVRFACVLDFAIEEETERAIGKLVGLIRDVSAERIWQEWAKVLANSNRATGWRLAQRTGLVAAIWPDLVDRAEEIARRLDRIPPEADAAVGLACQFFGLPIEAVHDRCRQLSLDNNRRTSVAWLVEHCRDLLADQLDLVTLKKRLASGEWTRLVQFATSLIEPGDPAGRAAALNLAANVEAAGRVDPAAVAPPPLIDGHDVMSMGQVEGPRIGQVLAAVYDAQLAEQINTREEALTLARELLLKTG